jgi:plastocyanin
MSRIAIGLSMTCLTAAFPQHAATLEVRVRDASGGPVADAVVYAAAPGGPATRATRAAIEQVDREFVPYVSVIQAGTTVSFPNRDPILHHVYSFSPAKPFEIKLYTGQSPVEVLFDKPGVVALGCNIHDWMIGYVVVVPTAHFGKTDASGVVRMLDVPGGAYEVRAWHPQQRGALAPQSLAFEGSASARAEFVAELAPRKARYKPPLDRTRY